MKMTKQEHNLVPFLCKNSAMISYIEPIIIDSKPEPDYAVIWLHGLGADGHDFEPLAKQLNIAQEKAIRFVFPHAPMQAVTINQGYVMPSWYDILNMQPGGTQDEAGIRESSRYLESLIEQQTSKGIREDKLVLAGFSQGGAVALHTGLRYKKRLAGIMALSTYLPLHDRLADEASSANKAISIFQAHGLSDEVLPPQMAFMTRETLQAEGYEPDWHSYKTMGHSLCPEEIDDINAWLKTVLSESARP